MILVSLSLWVHSQMLILWFLPHQITYSFSWLLFVGSILPAFCTERNTWNLWVSHDCPSKSKVACRARWNKVGSRTSESMCDFHLNELVVNFVQFYLVLGSGSWIKLAFLPKIGDHAVMKLPWVHDIASDNCRNREPEKRHTYVERMVTVGEGEFVPFWSQVATVYEECSP